MSRAILIYNLEEENDEFKIAQNAPSYFHALWEIYNLIRSLRKYTEETHEDYKKCIDDISCELSDIDLDF